MTAYTLLLATLTDARRVCADCGAHALAPGPCSVCGSWRATERVAPDAAGVPVNLDVDPRAVGS